MDPSASAATCQGPPHAPGCQGQPCVDSKDAPQPPTALHAFQEKNRHGWRRIVLHFTPSWFSVNMGTGIVSILLHNLPYNAIWLYWISVVIFCLNILIFIIFVTISAIRYLYFRGVWSTMLRHPVQSLFLGTFPMGLATIINMIVFVCVPAWGTPFVTLAWALWWLDVVVALATNLYLPFVIMDKHSDTQVSAITAAWLLPIVATIVAAASGGIVAEALAEAGAYQHAIWTVVTSYILWGCGVPLAMVVLVLYFQRLTVHSLPPREVIVSVFLPLGPLGQGSFGIMQLGSVALSLFGDSGFIPKATIAGQISYVVGILVAFIMWGFGLVWLFFALASISKHRFPFNLGWWGFTFPLGVYSVSTTQLSKELPSLFFKVLGTIFSLIVVLLWIIVGAGTLYRGWGGHLFQAPCIREWEASRCREKRQSCGNNKDAEAGKRVCG